MNVVCDNSDAEPAGRTAAALERFADSRIRYVRTSGTLSMADNWERSIADAIRRQARHEDTTRWDTIDFKLD